MNPLGNRAQVEALARLLEGGVSSAGHRRGPPGPRWRCACARSVPRSTALRSPRSSRVRTSARRCASAWSRWPRCRRPRLPTLRSPSPSCARTRSTAVTDAVSSWTQSSKAQRRLGVTAGAMAGVVAFTGVGHGRLAGAAGPGLLQPQARRRVDPAPAGQRRPGEGQQAPGVRRHPAARGQGARGRRRRCSRWARPAPLPPPAWPSAGRSSGGSTRPSPTSTPRPARAGCCWRASTARPASRSRCASSSRSPLSRSIASHGAPARRCPRRASPVAQESLTLVKQVQTTATEQLALGVCGGECFPGNAGPDAAGPARALAGRDGLAHGVPRTTTAWARAPAPPCRSREPPEPTDDPSPTPSPSPVAGPDADPVAHAGAVALACRPAAAAAPDDPADAAADPDGAAVAAAEPADRQRADHAAGPRHAAVAEPAGSPAPPCWFDPPHAGALRAQAVT